MIVRFRNPFRKKSTATLLKEYLMSSQDDVNTTVSAINQAASTLTTLATQLTSLNIPAPIDTSALGPASAALATAVTGMQTAVTAEAAKLTPTP